MVLAKRAAGKAENRLRRGCWLCRTRGSALLATPSLRARQSALAFGPADHALGEEGVDLAPGISELGQHLGRVLAEIRRHAAQAGLAALHADRRGDPLVPVLFDDVATMDSMGAGQRLVDPLHRSGRQAGGE